MGNSNSAAAARSSTEPAPPTDGSCPLLTRLADVELQLVLHWLDSPSKLRAAAASRRLQQAARCPLAWRDASPLTVSLAQVAREAEDEVRGLGRFRRTPLGQRVPWTLRWEYAAERCIDDPVRFADRHAPYPLFGFDAAELKDMEQLRELLRSSSLHNLRWLRLPRVREQTRYVGLRGLEVIYESKQFKLVAQMKELRTLHMPHEYDDCQLLPLLQDWPPLLNELECTARVFTEHIAPHAHCQPLLAQQLRHLHLHLGSGSESGGGARGEDFIDKIESAQAPSAQLRSKRILADEKTPPAANPQILSEQFAGLSTLRSLTLSGSLQQLLQLLPFAGRCPALQLLCLCPSSSARSAEERRVAAASLRALLDDCPGLHAKLVCPASRQDGLQLLQEKSLAPLRKRLSLAAD